jgi:hypothetical protein
MSSTEKQPLNVPFLGMVEEGAEAPETDTNAFGVSPTDNSLGFDAELFEPEAPEAPTPSVAELCKTTFDARGRQPAFYDFGFLRQLFLCEPEGDDARVLAAAIREALKAAPPEVLLYPSEREDLIGTFGDEPNYRKWSIERLEYAERVFKFLAAAVATLESRTGLPEAQPHTRLCA